MREYFADRRVGSGGMVGEREWVEKWVDGRGRIEEIVTAA